MADVIGLALLIVALVVASVLGGQWIDDRVQSAGLTPVEFVPFPTGGAP